MVVTAEAKPYRSKNYKVVRELSSIKVGGTDGLSTAKTWSRSIYLPLLEPSSDGQA
jgi:hypothetical protein